MVAGLRVIFAVVCVAVLLELINAHDKCGHASWGRKNANPRVDTSKIDALKTKEIVTISGVPGCHVIGAEVIACDLVEGPMVSFLDNSKAVVIREYAQSKATVAVITYCEPVYSPCNNSQHVRPKAKYYDVLPIQEQQYQPWF